MARLSFKLDQLFILLEPELVVGVCGTFSFPSEPDFVQKSLSIWSHCVVLMNVPLRTNPQPKRFVLLVLLDWHQTMAISSLKLNKLFTLLVPELIIIFRHAPKRHFKAKRQKWADVESQKRQSVLLIT
jgi:hypothetical protein